MSQEASQMFTVLVGFWLSYCYFDLKLQICGSYTTFYGALSAGKNMTCVLACFFLQCGETCVIVERGNAESGGCNTSHILHRTKYI